MNELNDLFVLGDDFLVNINREWISTHKAFEAIIKRDKGSPGDTQARLKLRAKKDFTFIYHFVGYRSKYRKYAEEERLAKAIEEADLPEGYKWEKDTAMVEAMELYKELQWTLDVEMLYEAQEACHKFKHYMKGINFTDRNNRGDLLYQPKEIRAMISEVGSMLDGLRDLEERVLKGEAEQKARGGVKIGNRELPGGQAIMNKKG